MNRFVWATVLVISIWDGEKHDQKIGSRLLAVSGVRGHR
jgi:hypothetical protein